MEKIIKKIQNDSKLLLRRGNKIADKKYSERIIIKKKKNRFFKHSRRRD